VEKQQKPKVVIIIIISAFQSNILT